MKETFEMTWHWTDIQWHDESLTKERCCEVLERLEARLDYTIGVNWDVIDAAIEYVKEQHNEL